MWDCQSGGEAVRIASLCCQLYHRLLKWPPFGRLPHSSRVTQMAALQASASPPMTTPHGLLRWPPFGRLTHSSRVAQMAALRASSSLLTGYSDGRPPGVFLTPHGLLRWPHFGCLPHSSRVTLAPTVSTAPVPDSAQVALRHVIGVRTAIRRHAHVIVTHRVTFE